MGTVSVACGLSPDDTKYIYFDAHDDLRTTSTPVHGYFDALGLPILLGESFEAVAKTIPGFKVIDSYEGGFLYVGLRDVTDFERTRVTDHGVDAVWGSTASEVDYVKELSSKLDQKSFSPALVHLDLDVLDQSLGNKVNGYESDGDLSEDELLTKE